jgi:hypothetical protein
MSHDPAEPTEHRFLDEAGDTTFYGSGRKLILGEEGVSLAFIIGMLKVSEPLPDLRAAIVAQQAAIAADTYVNTIPSVAKKIARGGFYFHAKDDPVEVRATFFKFIATRAVTFEAVVARKIPDLFRLKHHERESEFYADLLSHLIKNKLRQPGRLVLNVSHRANSTSNANLQLALEKAQSRALHQHAADDACRRVVFNVQNHQQEPILNLTDYCCWAVQRVFERGETRYYDFLGERIRLVVDLYDQSRYAGSRHYYRTPNRLTAENKLSPPSA